MIAERQKVEGWGKSVVEQLAKDLRAEFPGVRGYSAQNLWYMRQFFLVSYPLPGNAVATDGQLYVNRAKKADVGFFGRGVVGHQLADVQ